MPGISIKEETIKTITDSDGYTIKPGTPLQIRTNRGEDLLCRFVAIEGGYFVTSTMDGAIQNKYRVASIESSKSIKEITYKETEVKKDGKE